MNSDTIIPIVLQLLGVIVIVAEFVLPSGGLLSIAALGLFGYSLYMAFSGISTGAGFIFVAVDIIILPILVIAGLKILANSPVTLRTMLSNKDGVQSQSSAMKAYLHAEGMAYSDLHPSGTALINNKRVDVVSRGEYIEKDSPVVVVEVTANRIVVEKKEETQYNGA
ncbi:MAG: serine protease [Chitinivibrionales bacterium]|nr:serine protease [Chitinivibrionales bacterium]